MHCMQGQQLRSILIQTISMKFFREKRNAYENNNETLIAINERE